MGVCEREGYGCAGSLERVVGAVLPRQAQIYSRARLCRLLSRPVAALAALLRFRLRFRGMILTSSQAFEAIGESLTC